MRPGDPIPTGYGTVVKRDSPTVTVLRVDANPRYTHVRIVQRITLSADVLVSHPSLEHENEPHVCGICGAVPPLPDAKAAEYLLSYNSGGRIHWAERENIEPKGDAFPVVGWTKGLDHHLVCGECTDAINAAIAAATLSRRPK